MDFTEKIKWIEKNSISEISNMPAGPGKYVWIAILREPALSGNRNSGSGRMFGQDNIDDAIKFIQGENKKNNKQLELF